MKLNNPLLRQCPVRLAIQHNAVFIAILLSVIFWVMAGAGCASEEKLPDRSRIGGEPAERAPKWLRSWKVPKVPDDYRSPGELHKVFVDREDTKGMAVVRKTGPMNALSYSKGKLFLVSKANLDRLSARERRLLKVRDDMNLIRLRDRYFDTTVAPPKVRKQLQRSDEGEQLHLVQFVGPVQDDWVEELRRIKGLHTITHMPENAYLVWADEAARKSVAHLADLQPYVQWHGPFHPAYKIYPGFDLGFNGKVTSTIQLATHEQVQESIATIKARASKILRETYRVGRFTNILVQIEASELVSVARFEDVVNVEPWVEPELGGERQGQILADQLNAAGSQPNGPGYLAWLNGLGFNTNFGFVVDVADTGIDRGQTTAANLHQDFLDAAGNSRVAYVQRVDGINIDTTAANNVDAGGHGTIDLAIVGGFNNTPDLPGAGTDFEDGAGYQYGLGIAPFAQLGSSRIFAPNWTFPDHTELVNSAYSQGARISSNSWGNRAGANGSYDATSQEYDSLVRDARPSTASDGGEDGSQEMCIVFLAGNSGAGASTLWNCGSTAKNTLVVGASENWNQAGTDGSGITNAGANDARDIINFSSRGPCTDNRVKPDIMAPGTHVFGATSQDGNYDGTSISGGPQNGLNYHPNEDSWYPPDNCNDGAHPGDGGTNPGGQCDPAQTLYTWSSGTSQATPAVTGGAALVRQWFLNDGHPAPSPAMTKAYLMNSATHMTGTGANDDLPSNNQGMGRMNLGMAFDDTPRLLFDQVKNCYRAAAGETFTVLGDVSDNTRPFRATLAWTDAPGNPGAATIRENDLNLEVQVGGNTYRGNDFTLGISNVFNPANPTAWDDDNNVESVFLPAGTSGPFTVTVDPADIGEDGVPNNSDTTDQDFALVIHNAEFPGREAVDIVLVLDISGSMNGIAPGGTDKKIDLLKDAVEMFVRCWEPFSIPGDKMAVVYFNSTLATYPSPVALAPFQSSANNIIQDVRNITATSCTGLGGGIKQAYDLLPGSAHPKIVVFTNGMQNCSPQILDDGSGDLVIRNSTSTCSTCAHTALVPANLEISLADKNIPIHTIGTGVNPGSTWWTLLEDIANQSHSSAEYHFTTQPDEDLEDFFLEDLVECLKADPVEKVKTTRGVIVRDGQPKQDLFQLNSTVRQATFALSWRGAQRDDEALTFDLVAPNNGPTIPTGLLQIQTGTFYRIATVRFPLDVHGTRINPEGTWKLVIKPHNMDLAQVSYHAHLIVDDADVRYHFDMPRGRYGVGDVIPLTFWAQAGNRTLTNLKGTVAATVARPAIGFGSFLVKHPVSARELDQHIDLSGDVFAHPADKKSYILMKNERLRKELAPRIDTIRFYDDGKTEHGDAKANDGVYSALYRKTRNPGFYDFRVSVNATDVKLGTISRSESMTTSVRMKEFDLDKSSVEVKKTRPAEGKVAYIVSILPVDSLGNHLGPGHFIEVLTMPPGKRWGAAGRRIMLEDHLDGRYSGRVELTEREVKMGIKLVLQIDGKRIIMIR